MAKKKEAGGRGKLEGRKETRLLLEQTPTGEQINLLSMRGSHRGAARDSRLDIMQIQIIFPITSKGGLGVGEDWEGEERREALYIQWVRKSHCSFGPAVRVVNANHYCFDARHNSNPCKMVNLECWWKTGEEGCWANLA